MPHITFLPGWKISCVLWEECVIWFPFTCDGSQSKSINGKEFLSIWNFCICPWLANVGRELLIAYKVHIGAISFPSLLLSTKSILLHRETTWLKVLRIKLRNSVNWFKSDKFFSSLISFAFSSQLIVLDPRMRRERIKKIESIRFTLQEVSLRSFRRWPRQWIPRHARCSLMMITGTRFGVFHHFYLLLERVFLLGAFVWTVYWLSSEKSSLNQTTVFFSLAPFVRHSDKRFFYRFFRHRQSLFLSFIITRTGSRYKGMDSRTHTASQTLTKWCLLVPASSLLYSAGLCVFRLPIVNEAAIILFKKFFLSAQRSDKAFSTSTLTLV